MEGESRSLDDMSTDELRALIEFESQRHTLELETLIAQREKAEEMLQDRKQTFRTLIDKITSMRVEVCEFEADNPGCSHCPEDDELDDCGDYDGEHADASTQDGQTVGSGADAEQVVTTTTSHRVEELIQKVTRSFSTGKARLGQLLNALDAAVQPEGSPSVKPGTAYPPTLEPRIQKNLVLYNKTTNAYLVSRNEIRGLKGWWEKHFKSCSACGGRHDAWMKAKGLTSSAAIQHHVGSNALPDFAKKGGRHLDANKRCHRMELWLTSQPPLQDREDARTVDVLCIKARVAVTKLANSSENISCGSDATATATEAQKLLSTTVRDSLSALADKTMKAPWMQHEEAEGSDSSSSSPLSEETKVAIEVFLSSIGSNVAVSAADEASGTSDSKGFCLSVSVALTLPVHVSCVQPLMEAARHDAHQTVLVDRVFNPLIETVCNAIGMSSKAAFLSSVVTKASQVFQDIRRTNDASNQDRDVTGGQTASEVPQHIERDLRKKQIYNILHALAMHKTLLAFAYAVPRQADTDEISVASPVASPTYKHGTASIGLGKGAVLNILAEVIKSFVAPGAVVIPSYPSPDLMEFVLILEKAPVYVLDALNKEFSSTERVPSSRRTGGGLFEAVVSPQTKISLGLKLFSEMVVEIFRPYAPGCGAIVVEEEEKSQSFFKKSPTLAPPCVPRTDLPSEIVQANVAVHEEAIRILEKIEEEKRMTSQRDIEQQSKEILQRVRDRVSNVQLTTEKMKNSWTALGIQVQQWCRAEIDILLPFGQSAAHGGHGEENDGVHADAHLPVLYGCCSLEDASS